MMNGSNYSLSDIAAATGSNNRANDMWGGDGFSLIWLVLIFAIFGWGGFGGWGGGLGGNGANGAGFQGWATRADINEGFALNDIQNGIRGIQQGICDSTYALNNTMQSGFLCLLVQICRLHNDICHIPCVQDISLPVHIRP